MTPRTAPAAVTVSLITVSHNSAETLRRCWGSASLPESVEWIVVDNASSDDSVAAARELGAKVIDAGRNLGFSAANNLGLAHARGSFIGFVNPDVVVEFGELSGLQAVARECGALVAPQLLNADGTEQPNGRGFPLLIAKVRHRLRGGDPAYLLRSDNGKPRAVCWVMGAAILGDRAVFERLGGWDDRFFLYYEDKDIGLRAWKADVPVLLVPTARWKHGWARETTSLRWAPWRREIASMAKFYARYPEFLLGTRASRRAHPLAFAGVYGDMTGQGRRDDRA
ncbi:glycosyltransferase family 2 protein [Microbacterium sp. RD1]|uniref:glycosyltransferase family 2 protein n=1 Tax=Microbacterium sp. RD1 TaxID=3457313 RepID=UPI003FA551D6